MASVQDQQKKGYVELDILLLLILDYIYMYIYM